MWEFRKRTVLMAGACVIALSASPVLAQEAIDDGALETIVVVARKRAENVQTVPISITAITGEGLQARGIARVSDLVSAVPNLSQDGGGSVIGAIGIRGIVSQTRNIGFDSGLGVYVDGVLGVRPNSFDQELPDIATLEVLRGPQGTLFGRNTTAGAINITTRKPDLEAFHVEARAAYGNLNQAEGSVYLTGPLAPGKLGFKIAGSIASRDGYIRNLLSDDKLNNLDRKSLRGGLFWKAGDDVDVSLGGSWLKQADRLLLGQVADNTRGGLAGLPGFFDDPYLVAQDAGSLQTREIWTTNLNVDWRLGDYTLTSITAYGDNKSQLLDDDDARPIPLSTSNFQDGARQFTQELRLASPGGKSFDYLIGLYYLHQDADADRATSVFGPPGPGAFLGAISSISTLKTDAYAIFASGNLRPADGITISGGLRYNIETRNLDFRQTNTSFVPLPNLTAQLDRKDENLSGNLSVTYEFASNARVYASVARGFKSGGFNPDIVGSTDISFGPENAWSYEAGFKADLLDRKLRVNAAAFYTDYKDLQVSALVGAAFQIRNAAAAKIKGFEIEVTAKPVRAFEFNFGAGYTDATYDDFPGCGPGLNCAGNRLPFVPKLSLNAGGQLTLPVAEGSLVLRSDLSWRSSVFYEASNVPDGKLPGYVLVNGRIGYTFADDKLTVAVFGRNLFDNRYRDFSFYLAPFDQRMVRWAPPRTYGLEISTRF
ncbi:iron complex outermembrane receptor protein [Novosphingobium hassiacum]|uniref:Iron complex outermembrane receptor protein n=1 Tax=Novosphingobium hassiacum TaxID=173676 RepID=A0A7W6EWS2_9SPHN|nr:TonB-dependent receptor [Novosphingobium hassiacum]MBB3861290.1 iron complex outermembrane receptor protein [Novosphingobium hassiacum]